MTYFTKAFFVSLCLAVTAQAAPLKKKDLSPEFSRMIQQHQADVNRLRAIAPVLPAQQVPARPFSEVENAGYLFFSSDTPFDSTEAKRTMARDLPKDVTLVIFADRYDNKADILSQYSGLVPADRLKVITLDGAGRGFWARDGMPIPVWSQSGSMDMVDSHYYHGFEPDDELRPMFSNYVYRNDYYYEGGNFMPNDKGDCLMVNNDDAIQIPDDIFPTKFGCKRTIRLPFEKGIGHVDESARFLSSNVVVTDSPTYATTLRAAGFEVLMLPRPDRRYETYVNALLVNGTIFVPVYNETKDQMALDVYRSAGLNVVPIETISLSNDGLGSIHCITMSYPKVPFTALLGVLGAKELQ
jgi:hypothetical protein